MSIDDQKTSAAFIHKRPPSLSPASRTPRVEYRQLDGELVHCLTDVDQMTPFFMSLISGEDHWMFIASNGALTCGRGHADRALFPYYSSDKLLGLRHCTGPKTWIRVERSTTNALWEPFADHDQGYLLERNLYKNVLSSQIVFEEINRSLGLAFLYRWNVSAKFGFVRTVDLVNLDNTPKSIAILDGFQNLLPGGLQQDFQLRFSNLADAYKKSELVSTAQLGVFYLSSVPTDRAEPSEGLIANTVWSFGFQNPTVLLSDRQVAAFRHGQPLTGESDVRGQACAYLVQQTLTLPGKDFACWGFVADVHRDVSDVEDLQHQLETAPDLIARVKTDIRNNDTELWKFASQVDGLQRCCDQRRSDRHLSNALFNLLRGGVPHHAYQISVDEFRDFVRNKNRPLELRHTALWSSLPKSLDVQHLIQICQGQGDCELTRIAAEYLPLTLSRRHGDPTRPWNRFSIQSRGADGKRRIGFEGNWRDIFQNWEALAVSFPHYLPAMILRFVNASTVDGYNPYRLHQFGVDWERPEPNDPWSNIGYWGDHQIVYLNKLLDLALDVVPERMDALVAGDLCTSTRVPYRLRGFQQMLQSPHDTIEFDEYEEQAIQQQQSQIGFDGQLALNQQGRRHYVNLLEKLLLTAFVKIANYVPGGGIWMNTQRPEWNDAQNALAGYGASLVTAGHLYRYLQRLDQWLETLSTATVDISEEVYQFWQELVNVFADSTTRMSPDQLTDAARFEVVSRLQHANESYRQRVYRGFSGAKHHVAVEQLRPLLQQVQQVLGQALRGSQRDDGLYHSFTWLDFSSQSIRVEPLEEMLEGQVSILESGVLDPVQACQLLRSLRHSRLYRADQDSYLLYPNRNLPRFAEKNRIRANDSAELQVLARICQVAPAKLIKVDHRGDYHFVGTLRNAAELQTRLDELNQQLPESDRVAPSEQEQLLRLWENTFQHRRFTGRATTFFAYEGLGSIYWHMVSKLSNATIQACLKAKRNGAAEYRELLQHFRAINEGIWLRKSPERYGAFPTDPYSHTPAHTGAQQPGMTGQVKEDLLARFAELGVRYHQGQLRFDPELLRADEYCLEPCLFQFWDQHHRLQALELPALSMAFTVNQVPVIYRRQAGGNGLTLTWSNGVTTSRTSCELTLQETQALLLRMGEIQSIEVRVNEDALQNS